MAQSLANILLHVVFSTRDRTPWIHPAHGSELCAYLAGIFREVNCPALQVGAVDDHIHALCRLARTLPVSKLLEEVKKSSSRWIKSVDPRYADFAWQAGYGAFSVCESHAAAVRRYIANQAAHHRRVSFEEEFRRLLRMHNVPFDERYLFT